MKLVPREMDKLTIYTAARMAESRLKDGVKLNYPESVAIISDYVQERARRGDTVAKIMEESRHILSTDQVMPEVADMITLIQVEATFPDGTKLVSVHNPIQPKRGASR
ncbi:MAG: urease subunit gamma [Nitrososphaerota archaeon]|jgi:urease gamma subunit|nr:urease subunit gamma [Nitrososphaerota archaeon]MDG7038918.1 urease subunit gamma [Nitrososphaerota archaeon]MDG7041295.1 urease subunit gamma [Nitrososphaerota archaeon]MDG7046667.1 urease subunit gamma [Nitrososphaerota archaeon]